MINSNKNSSNIEEKGMPNSRKPMVKKELNKKFEKTNKNLNLK